MRDSVENPKMPMRLTVTQGKNGYTLSMYDDKGEKMMVAKNMGEVMSHMKEMMGDEESKKIDALKRKHM